MMRVLKCDARVLLTGAFTGVWKNSFPSPLRYRYFRPEISNLAPPGPQTQNSATITITMNDPPPLTILPP